MNLGKLLFLIIISTSIYAQQLIELNSKNIVQIPRELSSKIGSGDLIKVASEKLLQSKDSLHKNSQSENTQIVIYLNNYPTSEQIDKFQSLGLTCYLDTWTPALYDHPLGFFFAELPSGKLTNVLSLSFVKKIDESEQLSFPQNNESDKIINAEELWAQGWTGEGVKVCILDSGLDTDPTNPDLPSTMIKKDYSAYPTLDDDVENHITGHGTHVTGSVLGRGMLSIGNTGNGGGSYKGVAPSADLVFLKIGNDYSAGASTTAIINAMDAAVNIYNVDVISMSYGYWDTYHDGTSTQDQKVDWCYSQGVPVFLAAGNYGLSKRHYSGTVGKKSETDFIKINVTNAPEGRTSLYFNLVWSDGIGTHNNLNLKYYDEAFQEITDVYYYLSTESPRGTESQYSQVLHKLPAGNGVYYVKIENSSNSLQAFHIYESYNNGTVTFENPDPNYTITTPSTATFGFSVGAFTTREEWTSSSGSQYTNKEVLNEVASYSSKGPRIDGLQKPDLVAPGSSIISIRDRDVLTIPDANWIDNDGNTTGDANYYVMDGTSMAAPHCAGAAALFLNKYPDASPLDVYNALKNNADVDTFTGAVPNNSYGYGKLDIYSALNSSPPLPVELSSFSSIIKDKIVILSWKTQTEVNNYGFEVQRSNDKNEWSILDFVEGNGNSNSPQTYTYFDKEIKPIGKYYYRLRQIDNNGSYSYSDILKVNFKLPDELKLNQNYPNPFNPSTNISFTIPHAGNVILRVFNTLGEEISIVTKGFMESGEYSYSFNAEGLTSGMYIYRLSVGKTTLTKKMLFLK